VRAPGNAGSRAWQVLVGGTPAGLVRPTWQRERGRRPGWEAVDNAGMPLPASGTGRTTPAGNARTRAAAAAVNPVHALLRWQQDRPARKKPPWPAVRTAALDMSTTGGRASFPYPDVSS
jgi:hypothetical protein